MTIKYYVLSNKGKAVFLVGTLQHIVGSTRNEYKTPAQMIPRKSDLRGFQVFLMHIQKEN